MLSVVPFITKGIIAFLVPTGLGVLAYALATLVAHLGRHHRVTSIPTGSYA